VPSGWETLGKGKGDKGAEGMQERRSGRERLFWCPSPRRLATRRAVYNVVGRETGQSRFDNVALLVLVRVSIDNSVDTGGGDSGCQNSLSLWARQTTRLPSSSEGFNCSSCHCSFKSLCDLSISTARSRRRGVVSVMAGMMMMVVVVAPVG